MRGLMIKPQWADLILNGEKDLELRSRLTNIRGKIGIIKSGTGMIFGTVELIDCQELHHQELAILRDRHRVENINAIVPYARIYGWALANAKWLPEPVPYHHKQGSVIWVNFPDELIGGEHIAP